jgi:hypothetical protein
MFVTMHLFGVKNRNKIALLTVKLTQTEQTFVKVIGALKIFCISYKMFNELLAFIAKCHKLVF